MLTLIEVSRSWLRRSWGGPRWLYLVELPYWPLANVQRMSDAYRFLKAFHKMLDSLATHRGTRIC
jgi:hypothetical protein